jgi:hypothetical protein
MNPDWIRSVGVCHISDTQSTLPPFLYQLNPAELSLHVKDRDDRFERLVALVRRLSSSGTSITPPPVVHALSRSGRGCEE